MTSTQCIPTLEGLPVTREDLRLIAQVGFVGTESGQVPASRALFKALQLLRPDSALPWIGLAMCELSGGRAEDAVRLLRDEALQRHPGDPEVQAFLGMALQGAGKNTEAHALLTDVLAKAGGAAEPYVAMARKLLDNARFMKDPARSMPGVPAAAARAD